MATAKSNLPNDDDEDIIIDPTKENYQDRKMAKWMGFILSDHTEAIKANETEEKKVISRKNRQSGDVISSHLSHAYAHNLSVSIQLNFISGGEYEEDIEGKVKGFEDGFVYVKTADDFLSITFSLIRHVELLNTDKWFLT